MEKGERMIKVEYKAVTEYLDAVTFRYEDVDFDVLLVNKQGLYYLFHSGQILNVKNCLADFSRARQEPKDFAVFNLRDAQQIPADIARIFTGE